MSSKRPQPAPGVAAPRPLPGILELAPYRQGASEIAGRAAPIKLSSNESALGPSPAALEGYHAAARALNRYPDGSQRELRAAIAEVHGLDPGRIFCGNGSAELIGLLIKTFVGPGDELLLPQSHFEMCPIYGKAQGARIVLAPDAGDKVGVDALLAAITPRTRLIAVANPSNPTGTYLARDEVERLHAGVPAEVVLLLDGAYAEFVTGEDYDPGTGLVERTTNAVMTRTFSKAYGLAGLRIGWAYAPAGIAEVVQRIRVPFNASSAAMAAAAAAVRDADYLAGVRAHNRRWLDRVRERLRALGFPVSDSSANFYLIDFSALHGRSAAAADAFLKARGILARPAAAGCAREVLRITVGTDAENEAVLDALSDYVSGRE